MVLEVKSLSCRRDGRNLFSDCSFYLKSGQMLEVHGSNGSGKSTLLRCLAGLYTEFEGDITSESFFYYGHKLGLSSHLTVEENIAWYAHVLGVQVNLPNLLVRVGMEGYERALCSRLSEGQLRRVSLVRLLLRDRPLWLLDEPQTSLDIDGRELLRKLILDKLANNGAVVCSTHQPLEITGHKVLLI
tara:strand:- start:577 stop:1137 length:561 start_codon:yes stop_codon:yes gene_type:complete